ncbi:glycoside hydrolase family 3 N-terminal domain-containing protein [Demequina silvatica]|uniref:glycoside hydrolase family 3 N-terminal domain-containing protein n=1 Tax=Demequina silvatica TaxID=1638988 RepID=UPI0007830F88|nr:glycoside hydrolase family 3 N-terminal domain-containing protein [Demequina silvatica]
MKSTKTVGGTAMRSLRGRGALAFAGVGLAATLAGCTGSNTNDASPSPSADASAYTTTEVNDGDTTFVVVDNPGDAPDLSYGAESGVTLLEETVDGATVAFKDMNANGTLDTWEDWRVDAADRAADLSAQMSIEQIAGLMLFSSHERSPADGLTDAQMTYLKDSNLRAVLNAAGSNADETVPWVNAMQAYVETLATADTPYVPVNFASDPRSEAATGGVYNADGADISRWPSNLGLAATFNAEYTKQFGEMASAEYRALGITTALSPQIDLATEPRWLRVSGTFGEDSAQAAELAAAYVDGFQGSEGTDAWGSESVNAMIKHFAGDGPGEGGRESHTAAGKYGVYPGDNLDEHVSVFEGALDSAAMMTAYSVALDADGEPLLGAERMGTAYDSGRMEILRDDLSYEGVVVTDWGVMTGSKDEGAFIATAWGAEDLTPAERYLEVLANGTDMFGGVNDATFILEGADLWQEKFEAGELDMDAETRFQLSGTRILNMFFQTGLYEDAFLAPEVSASVLASEDKVAAGYEAQLASIVMLKNDGTVAEGTDWSDKTVYIPQSYDVGLSSLFGEATYTEGPSMDLEVAKEFFGEVVTDEVVYKKDGTTVKSYTAPDLSDVDLVLVGMNSPTTGAVFGNSGFDAETGEYYPMSLQYREYTADGDNVRKVSISGDILEDGTKENRSYFGNSVTPSNEADLDAFERAVAAVEASGNDIPVVVALKATNATIPAEFEADADAILVSFGTSDQAVFDVATGGWEPTGRLPIQFPKDMDTVEAQLEDVAKDVTPYTDAAGNSYDYGFGLNYAGQIS